MGSAFGRLRFSRELELRFSEYSYAHALSRTRFAIVLALVLFALFGALDAFLAPDEAPRIWVIRYAIVCPIGACILGLTFTQRFRSIMQAALSAFAVIAGLGIVAMIAVTEASVGYLYYAGLLLVIPWICTLLQLRFPYATAACLAIIAGYEVDEPVPPSPPQGKDSGAVDHRPVDAVGVALEHGKHDRAAVREPHDMCPSGRHTGIDQLGYEVRRLPERERRQMVAAPEAGEVRCQAMQPSCQPIEVHVPHPRVWAPTVKEYDGGDPGLPDSCT